MCARYNPPPPDRPGPRDGGAGLPPPTFQACAELLEGLDRFAGLQAHLDRELHTRPEEQEAATEVLWAARADCDRLADALLRSQPETPAEAAAKRHAITLYLLRTEVDRLLWQSYLETDLLVAHPPPSAPAAGPARGLSWRAWLKRGGSSTPG